MHRSFTSLFIACLGLVAFDVRAQDSNAAFQDVLDSLETSRDLILARTPEDGTDRAEGLRHLLRLVEMQNARATDDHDPAHPHISRCPSLVCKVGFDNPDFTYINVTPLSPDYTYRIFGQRGTVPYLSMQIFDNPFGGTEFMTSDELVVNDDGSYEVILSATEPDDAANWLELKPGAFFFILRNGFYDWSSEVEASVQVEVVSGPMSGPVPHLTPSEFVDDASSLALRLRSIPRSIFGARDGWPLNDVNEPDTSAFGIPGAGVPGAISSAGRYELSTDQAMIIETPEPNVVHGGIQVGNLWVESIDYQTRQTSLNWFQSVADSDGIIRYVLAHEDPGVPNWLDISGHPIGSVFFRWQNVSEDDFPEKPTVTVVPFDEIRDNLPSDHPSVSPSERAETLRQRYLAVNKRRNPPGQYDAIQAELSDLRTAFDELQAELDDLQGSGGGCSVGGAPGGFGTMLLLALGLVARRRFSTEP